MVQRMAYNPSEDKKEKTEAILAMQGNPTQAALLGYIAGIIDGEGTISIYRTKPKPHWNFTYSARMSMGMVGREVPDLLKDVIGGNVREERVPERRSIWRWELTGRFQMLAVLRTLLPFLRVKKEQAELAIIFCENWVNPRRTHREWIVDAQELQRREDAFQEMRKLNAVGAEKLHAEAGATTNRLGAREGEVIVCPNGKPLEEDPKRSSRHASGQ